MKGWIFLALAMLAPFHVAVAADAPSQTAFFCLLGKVDGAGNRSGSPRSLNLLLGGHPSDTPSPSPIATYDPAGLLEAETFRVFLTGPQSAPGYMIITRELSDNGAFLLSLTPIEGQGGRYDAVLGRRGSNKPGQMGQCFGPVGPISEAEFLEESRREPR